MNTETPTSTPTPTPTPTPSLRDRIAAHPAVVDLCRPANAFVAAATLTEMFLIVPNVLADMYYLGDDMQVPALRITIFAIRMLAVSILLVHFLARNFATAGAALRLVSSCTNRLARLCCRTHLGAGDIFDLWRGIACPLLAGYYLMITPINGSTMEDGTLDKDISPLPSVVHDLIVAINVCLFLCDAILLIVGPMVKEGRYSCDSLSKIYAAPEVSRVGDGKVVLTDICYICLEEYTDGEFVAQLPCNHCFHAHCCKQWLTNHFHCPLRCRGAVSAPVWKEDPVVDAISAFDSPHQATRESPMSRQALTDTSAAGDFIDAEGGAVQVESILPSQMPPDFGSREASTDVEDGLAQPAATLPSQVPLRE